MYVQDLEPGAHTMAVRTVDEAGLVDNSPASTAWIVDGASAGGPPSMPVKATATARAGALDVTWAPPLDDGGAPLLAYHVQGRPVAASDVTILLRAKVEGGNGADRGPPSQTALEAQNQVECVKGVAAAAAAATATAAAATATAATPTNN